MLPPIYLQPLEVDECEIDSWRVARLLDDRLLRGLVGGEKLANWRPAELVHRLLGQNAFFVQKLKHLLHAIGLAILAGVENEIGRRRRLVNAVDAGKAVQLAGARLFVELCNFQVC